MCGACPPLPPECYERLGLRGVFGGGGGGGGVGLNGDSTVLTFMESEIRQLPLTLGYMVLETCLVFLVGGDITRVAVGQTRQNNMGIVRESVLYKNLHTHKRTLRRGTAG